MGYRERLETNQERGRRKEKKVWLIKTTQRPPMMRKLWNKDPDYLTFQFSVFFQSLAGVTGFFFFCSCQWRVTAVWRLISCVFTGCLETKISVIRNQKVTVHCTSTFVGSLIVCLSFCTSIFINHSCDFFFFSLGSSLAITRSPDGSVNEALKAINIHLVHS